MESVYVGTKIILAEPMSRAVFLATVKKQQPKEEDNKVAGYKVKYPPFVLGDDNYVSWSPKDVFENAYREITESEAQIIINQ